ncbi:protein ANTAGONIST OF LIKE HETEROCHROMATIN PROTEIN 1 [Ixodes scapularis]
MDIELTDPLQRVRKPPRRLEATYKPTPPVQLDLNHKLRQEFYAVVDRLVNEVQRRFRQDGFDMLLRLEEILVVSAKGKAPSLERLEVLLGIHASDFSLDQLRAQLLMLPTITSGLDPCNALSIGEKIGCESSTVRDLMNQVVQLVILVLTMKRMRDGDVDFFVRFYRMTPPTFDELHDMVKEDLTRQFFIREPLPSEERLAIALSYLSSGQQIKDVALLYRVGLETARQAVHVTCRALWERLHQPFMKPPTEAEWVEIAEGFRRRWQFPNCLGAVDGKHVAITCPKDSGSVFYNYKGTYSIVLMAVVDSKYKFVLIDVGAEGRQSDGGIFKASEIGQGLDQGTLNLPKLGVLPGCQKPRLAPYAFVGDEAFQLRTDFLRPYPAKGLADERRAYNYRLSRAR